MLSTDRARWDAVYLGIAPKAVYCPRIGACFERWEAGKRKELPLADILTTFQITDLFGDGEIRRATDYSDPEKEEEKGGEEVGHGKRPLLGHLRIVVSVFPFVS